MAKTRHAPALHVLLILILAVAAALSAARAEYANPHGVAVIIGNKAYRNERVPEVAYAHRDAEAFRRFVVDVLGFNPDNLIDLRDATQAEMETAFGNERSHEGRVWRYLHPRHGSDVLVFYSGHGVPGLKDRRGYLLPVDADPDSAEINGYPIDLLYANLGKLDAAKSVRVFLEACFSGDSDRGMLVRSASPVFVQASLPEASGDKLTVLAAASGQDVASWDDEAEHGLFTHHLLDALYGAGDADGDGRVTAAEAKVYLDDTMTIAARRGFGRNQYASLNGVAGAVLARAGAGGAFPPRPSPDDDDVGTPVDNDGDPELTEEHDKYLFGLGKAFESKDYPKVLKYIGKLEELGGALPAEADYFRGEAEVHTNRFREAVRSLERYVARAGRKGIHYRRSQELLLELEEQDEAAYERAMTAGTAASFGEYLSSFPEGRHAEKASQHQLALRAAEARLREEEAERKRLAAERRAAEHRANDDAFGEAKRLHTPASYQAYLERGGRHEAAARALLAGVTKPKWEIGKKFRDCPGCPEMVVVPAGSYEMGSPPGEGGRDDDEGPVHRVTISERFAVGVYEVTFREWDACHRDGGCSRNPDDSGWGRGERPVFSVSWEDVLDYVDWLSAETGEEYRLLSESEWEYVARAGTVGRYHWGNGVGRSRANCDGCGSRWDGKQTSPVGSFPSNDFGLHDVHGNVWEWVEDCWHGSYEGAPSDGSAWTSGGDCGSRVLRGGSWHYSPWLLRSADRYRFTTGFRDNGIGFRVSRTLD